MNADSMSPNFVSWPVANLVSSGAFSTGWRGTGRTFTAKIVTKRGRGKPQTAARLRGDLIVAYVRELERTSPEKMDIHIVPKVAALFGVGVATVWNALRVDRKPGPIDLGSITLAYTHTGITYSGKL